MLKRAARLSGVGLAMREALPPQRLAELARTLDEHEGVTLWLPEFALRESFTQLGYLAGCTERLRLANGVVPMAARTPVSSALAAATLEDLSGGRAILGLGVSHPSMTQGWHGQDHRSSLTWAEEYLTVVRQVLDGGESELDGSEVRSMGFSLLDGARPEVPTVLAALGPRMLEVGARHADGVLLNWTTPAYARESLERVEEAASACDRSPPAVGAYVRVAAGPDAEEQARQHADFYTSLPAYRSSLLRMGLRDDASLSEEAASSLILRGGPDQIVDQVGAWTDSGIDPVVIYPIGDSSSIDAALELGAAVVGRLAAARRGR
jgi:alkanesulfonate monooxygenase SsuD/methylene tetrahydromethanopterin reductase-like flavin-dependent oxidoreductase (luciferase family)